MILAIDFDGCVIRADAYPDPPCEDDLKADAVEALTFLKSIGCELILWTCRSYDPVEQRDFLKEAVEFCKSVGIFFNYVNANTDAILEQYGRNNIKVHADIYIDDKNLGGFSDWQTAMLDLLTLYPNDKVLGQDGLVERWIKARRA